MTKLAEEFGKTGAFQHGVFSMLSDLLMTTLTLSLCLLALVTTTQAIDVIHGGSKVNSLPEEVTLLMNHRISFSSNISQTQASLASLTAPIADKFKLNFSAFAREAGETKEVEKDRLGSRYIKVETLGEPLEPAPRSVVEGEVWALLAGSIKAAFPKKDGKERIVSPAFAFSRVFSFVKERILLI